MWLAQSDTDCAALWLVLKLLTGGDKHILFISSFIGFTCLSSFAMSSQILNHKYPCGTTWRRGYMCRVNQTTPPDRTPEVFRFLLRCFAGCGSLSSLIYRIGCGISSTTFCLFLCAVWSNNNNLESAIRSFVGPFLKRNLSIVTARDSPSSRLCTVWHYLCPWSGFVVARIISKF